MNVMPTLRTALLDVLHETRDDDLRLIIGGGYGIYLKREHVRQQGRPTLFREWPEARSTTIEAEWERALALRKVHENEPSIVEAARIADRHFSSLNSDGMLRMRESPYCRPGLQLDEFCKALRELFPPQSQTEVG